MNIKELIGKTFAHVVKSDTVVSFFTSDGKEYVMAHSQDCCEWVYIESVVGDLDDLVGEPILLAEESSSGEDPEGYTPKPSYYDRESFTWTFYKFATRKGYVDIRWLGESNGYYGEGVELHERGRSFFGIDLG